MLHDTEFMNVTSLDEKLQPWAAENLLKDIGKVEGIETNPLNPENISNTAVEDKNYCSDMYKLAADA